MRERAGEPAQVGITHFADVLQYVCNDWITYYYLALPLMIISSQNVAKRARNCLFVNGETFKKVDRHNVMKVKQGQGLSQCGSNSIFRLLIH